jgi:hypothetical protein
MRITFACFSVTFQIDSEEFEIDNEAIDKILLNSNVAEVYSHSYWWFMTGKE